MTEAPPLVSVIVPTKNSARTLDSCLTSIKSQSHAAIELIVVDNHSTDQTPSIALAHCDLVETWGPERSAQRNRGAAFARGDFLLFVDSDMSLSSQVVEECIAAIREPGAAAVVIPEESVGRGFLARCRALERSCYRGDDVVEAARFFRRADFEAVDGFDEQLIGMEDWDLTRRVAGGRNMPRIKSGLRHDEGTMRLGSWLAKKRYYASSSFLYIRKHRGHAIGQANLIFRPAYARNWKRLLRHPVLTAGFLALKAMETGAIAWGALEAVSARGPRLPHRAPPVE